MGLGPRRLTGRLRRSRLSRSGFLCRQALGWTLCRRSRASWRQWRPCCQLFFLTLTSGPLQGRKRSFYLLVATDQTSAGALQIPHSVEALGIRARHGEGTRLRCLDVNCGLRSTAERQELEVGADKGPKSELAPEHAEEVLEDVMREDEEDSSAAKVAVVVVGGTGPRSCVRDLWPYAMPKDYYKAILSAIVGSEASSHFVYLSSTAHPAALLAAKDMNLQVHYVLDGCRGHSIAHGQKLMSDTLFREFYEAERKNAQHVKRVLEEDVRFTVLTAPILQAVRVDSVASDKNWRSGEDNCPSTEFLEQHLPRLFASELDKFGFQSPASTPSISGWQPIRCAPKAWLLCQAGGCETYEEDCWLDS